MLSIFNAKMKVEISLFCEKIIQQVTFSALKTLMLCSD
jgi:hypothetical protein